MRSMPGRFTLSAVALMYVVVLAACNCAPTLRYITVAPTTMSIDAGTTQQFTATTYYSDGTQTDATATAAWSSSTPAVATISAAGVASGLTLGTSTITATFGGVSASATLTVARSLQTLVITPAAVTVGAGQTQQYDAMGTYTILNSTTPTTVDVTAVANWNSSKTTVATIDSTQDTTNGLATSLAQGATNITATLDGITSNTAVLTVGAPVQTGLQVTPSPATVAVGNAITLTAVELFSDASTIPLTSAATWTLTTCAPAGSATIVSGGTANNSSEIVSGQTVTTTACTVTATQGTFTGTSAVSVVAGTATSAYLANSGGNPPGGSANGTISQFSVAAATSPYLTPLTPATVTQATPPQVVILHPNGLYAYSIDVSSQVHIYDIAPAGSTTPPAGTLTLRSGDPVVVAGASDTNIGAIDPTGRFLYVTDSGNGTSSLGTLNGFTISQTDGTLTPISGVVNVTTNLNGPSDAVIDRTGKFLYVVNDGNASVCEFTIGAGGTVTAGVSTPSGTGPVFATVDSANPSAQILIVPGGDNTVTTYTINATTGALGVGTTTTITGAAALDNAVVDPTGSFLYLVDFGNSGATPALPSQVYAFNISSAGVIGAEIGTPLKTDVSPGGIVIDPTGKLLLIDTNGSNSTSATNIDLYTVGTGGALTAVTAVPAGIASFGIALYVANH